MALKLEREYSLDSADSVLGPGSGRESLVDVIPLFKRALLTTTTTAAYSFSSFSLFLAQLDVDLLGVVRCLLEFPNDAVKRTDTRPPAFSKRLASQRDSTVPAHARDTGGQASISKRSLRQRHKYVLC